MLLHFLLVVLLSSFVTADVTCPDGKLSCPDGKTCCFASGHFTCCDLSDDSKFVPGSPSHAFRNTSENMANKPLPYYDYCPYTTGKKLCCDYFHVQCFDGSDCCTNGKCCYRGARCCGNGQWCCTKPLKCGTTYMSCHNSAITFAPTTGTLAAMAMAYVASKLYFL